MRIILQRVSEASVTVDEKIVGKIGPGLLLFVGIEDEDTDEDLEWLAGKITKMRIFSDAEGKMNHSVKDVDGDILAVSQFTLHASVKKGNRPSFMGAARPEYAIPMYEKFIKILGFNQKKLSAIGFDRSTARCRPKSQEPKSPIGRNPFQK